MHILKILSARPLTDKELKAVWERYRTAGGVGKDDQGTDFLQQALGCSVLADKDPTYTSKELREAVERAGLKWKEGYEGRVKRFRASDETVDSYGDIILQNGWKFDRYKKNPVFMYGHDYRGLPIGSCVKYGVENKALVMDHLFALGEDYPFADTCFKLTDARMIKGNSVGFIPRKVMRVDDEDERRKLGLGKYGVVFVKSELLEDSLVSIGANPNALVQNALNDAVRKGILTGDNLEQVLRDANPKTKPPETILEMLEQAKAVLGGTHIDIGDAGEDKAVIPFKAYPLAPENTKWNGPKEVKAAEVADLKIMCTWYDATNADVKGSYKLPHHLKANKNTVWKGVAAAMGVVLGARGGLKVPEAERKRVYGHLSKHYKEFEKDVPEYKDYDEAALKELEAKGMIVIEAEDKDAPPTDAVGKPGYDETTTSIRYRVREPGLFRSDTFKTVPIKKSKPRVNSVMGKLKKNAGKDDDPMILQSLIFPKADKWTLEKAKKWVKDHPDLVKAIQAFVAGKDSYEWNGEERVAALYVVEALEWDSPEEYREAVDKAEVFKEETASLDTVLTSVEKIATQVERFAGAMIEIEARIKSIEDTVEELDVDPGKRGIRRGAQPQGLADVLFQAEETLGLIKPKKE